MATLAHLPAAVERFDYDRGAQDVGIVHFGIGAFHRAHQAWYTDRAMDAGDRNWAITGISLRSRAVALQMNPQDGLYTVTERSEAKLGIRLVGSVRNVVPISGARARVEYLLAAPTTQIVTLTITEKGYCKASAGTLDHEMASDRSIYASLAAGLRRRRDAGCRGLTLLSCDNLSGNGAQLAQLMSEYLDRNDPELRAWFEAECACPSTMVDRIVPATTQADLAVLTETIGLEDAAAVMTEPFSQWVIEDRFATGRPQWEKVGAELVSDVAAYETAKLRMLNGAHSALAYLGLAAGHEFVHQAIADPTIRLLIEQLMRDEAAGSLTPAPGQHLSRYADALLARFANPALQHRLSQIAMDGSQKIPQRWLETLAHQQLLGRQCPAILTALVAWLRHVRGDNGVVDDPLADRLKALWSEAGREGILGALFGAGGLISSAWNPSERDRSVVCTALSDT